VLHALPAPLRLAARALGLPTLDGMLLGRHRAIDALLEDEIAAGRVGQVLELAAGLSPRGWRFTERHAGLVYLETDLPEMAARKRAALAEIGRPPGHRVAELDALAADGPQSLGAVTAALDPGAGLAVIAEGLLSYLPREAVLGLWSSTARELGRFAHGVHLADLHVGQDAPALLTHLATGALSAFVRSPVAVHFATAADARAALVGAGFAEADVRRASAHPASAGLRGAEHVRVVRAVR